MAKIQKYSSFVDENDWSQGLVELDKVADGDYIKVSELREWIKENEFYFLGIKTLTSKMLLAAIDMEGK